MTIVLVVAMVMTISMVVVAYAYYAPEPAWNQGTGRYTKDVDAEATLRKMYPQRDALVQCTSNGLTAFPTYYQVRKADSANEILSDEISYTGTGNFLVSYPYNVSPNTSTYLGIRTDPRCSSSVINKGNWSPDNY